MNVCISMLIYTFLTVHDGASVIFFFASCVCESLYLHTRYACMCAADLHSLSHTVCTHTHTNTLTHSRCTLTPWRLGLPVVLELGSALLDKLFPLRACGYGGTMCPFTHCLFSMSL